MRLLYQEAKTGGRFAMAIREPGFAKYFLDTKVHRTNTIIWNRGPKQQLLVDEMVFDLPANVFTTLNVNQSFKLERSQDAVVWEFNDEFYCIVEHDEEVSCVGLLFYGWREATPIVLDDEETAQFERLLQVFVDEFSTTDNIQGEMLRVLLKRLIIKLTRLIKAQADLTSMPSTELDTIRRFNMLVEKNFKRLHQVRDYAGLLFKSPKTLSNLFSKYSDRTPLQVIDNRLFIESKRLLIYTDKSVMEIAFDLGFKEASHFSRFFRKMSSQTPSEFKRSVFRTADV